jgi:hypothetical protein
MGPGNPAVSGAAGFSFGWRTAKFSAALSSPHANATDDRAAPSSLASTANRMTTTESPFLKTINDFCNKICHKQTSHILILAHCAAQSGPHLQRAALS